MEATTRPAFLDYSRQFYRMARTRLAARKPFVDLSAALNGVPGPQFFDFAHTGPLISPRIESALANRLAPYLH